MLPLFIGFAPFGRLLKDNNKLRPHIYCTVAKVRSLTGKIQIECFMYLTVRLRQVLSFQKQNDRDISQVVFYFEYYQTAQIGADFVRARETEKPLVLTVCGRESLLADRAKKRS